MIVAGFILGLIGGILISLIITVIMLEQTDRPYKTKRRHKKNG